MTDKDTDKLIDEIHERARSYVKASSDAMAATEKWTVDFLKDCIEDQQEARLQAAIELQDYLAQASALDILIEHMSEALTKTIATDKELGKDFDDIAVNTRVTFIAKALKELQRIPIKGEK